MYFFLPSCFSDSTGQLFFTKIRFRWPKAACGSNEMLHQKQPSCARKVWTVFDTIEAQIYIYLYM